MQSRSTSRTSFVGMECLEERSMLSAPVIAAPQTLVHAPFPATTAPPAAASRAPLTGVGAALTSPIIADHRAIPYALRLTRTTADLIARRLSFFFAHASVGSNIVDGLNGLHSANSSIYRLAVVSDDGTPPAKAYKGRVYEFARGNPSWQEKVDDFKTYLDAGWGGRVNVVLNKFCYIDPAVTLAYYAKSNINGSAMAQLEARYPNTKFVYMTIPLTTDDGGDNIQRNSFNIALRKWVKANNKILLDVADVESWSPRGVQATFKVGTKVYQKMYASYSSDGGHLSDAGARRVALAWYALAAALAGE